MKTIITKLLKGESLTDEERAKVEAFDIDKLINDAAAAARRKAETERDSIKEQLESAKTAAGGRDAEIEKLTKRIKAIEDAKAAAEAEASALKRASTLRDIRTKAGLKFIDGVDPKLLESAFASAFDGVEDFSDEAAVQEIVTKFSSVNKALLVDQSGFGTGQQSVPNTEKGQSNPYSSDHFNLTKQIELERTNPQLAESLKAQAN